MKNVSSEYMEIRPLYEAEGAVAALEGLDEGMRGANRMAVEVLLRCLKAHGKTGTVKAYLRFKGRCRDRRRTS